MFGLHCWYEGYMFASTIVRWWVRILLLTQLIEKDYVKKKKLQPKVLFRVTVFDQVAS